MNTTIFFSLYDLAHQSKVLDWLIVFSANNFGYIMVFLALVYIFFYENSIFKSKISRQDIKDRIKKTIKVFSAPLAGWVFAEVIKSLIHSPRPFLYFQNVKPLFLHGGFDSFPSGHSFFFAALATSLYFENKRMGLAYVVVALIVGLARIASGVHFPVDVFFGYVFGFLIALIFKAIFNKIK